MAERKEVLQALSWICCAYRPLNSYEVKDGIAFRKGQCTPDLRRRIDRSLVSLCGPIIEESPSGIIDMVHFSAKEYLLDPLSGPFIDRMNSHSTIALSCISFLSSRLHLSSYLRVDTSTPTSSVVAQAFNGLDRYAHYFWLDHVLAVLDLATNSDEIKTSGLFEALQKFTIIALRDSRTSSDCQAPVIKFHNNRDRDYQNNVLLKDNPGIWHFLIAYGRYKKNLLGKESEFETIEGLSH